MNEDIFLLILFAFKIGFLLVTLIYAIGIVWRVEMELDVSYKFLAFAVFFLAIAEIIDVVPGARKNTQWILSLYGMKLLAAASLFFGMYFMRDLVRRLDGERKKTSVK